MFRLIDDGIWDDPQIAQLPRDEKLIMVCLFTNVHAKCCGIYRITADRIGHMVDIPKAKVLKGLAALAKEDIAHYDGNEICIPGYIRRQRYKGPTMARRISMELSQVKNKRYVEMIVIRYPDFLKAGGFKMPKVMDLEFTVSDEAKSDVAEAREIFDGAVSQAIENKSITDLSLEIAKRLKYTGGVKASILAKLVKEEPGGEVGVLAAVARVEKYYAIVKAEKWHSFIIARRFSKFCDFYGEAFSSDEALEEYLAKIRAGNEREIRQQKREGYLWVGASRPEIVESKPEKEKSPAEIKTDEIAEIKLSLVRAHKFLEDPYKKVSNKDRKAVLENIERYEAKLKEMEV